MDFNKIRFWLINYLCFCICCNDTIEQQCVPVTEITASEYIKYKKRGLSDYRIYELTGYCY